MSAETKLTSTAAVASGVFHLFTAPLGTALPTDIGPTTPAIAGEGLNAAFVDMGYFSDDGIAINVDAQTKDLYASQSLDPLKTLLQSRKMSFEGSLLEWSANSLPIAFGGGAVTATANGAKYTPPAEGLLTEISAVLDVIDGAEISRFVMERGLITGSVKGSFSKADFAALPIVVTALAPVTLPTSWFLLGSNQALEPAS